MFDYKTIDSSDKKANKDDLLSFGGYFDCLDKCFVTMDSLKDINMPKISKALEEKHYSQYF